MINIDYADNYFIFMFSFFDLDVDSVSKHSVQSMTSNCHTFFRKKLQKSVTIWEHLAKRYHFWTIIKQKKEKSVTIWSVTI